MRIFLAELPQPLLCRRTVLVQGQDGMLIDLHRVLEHSDRPGWGDLRPPARDPGEWNLQRVLSWISGQAPSVRAQIVQEISRGSLPGSREARPPGDPQAPVFLKPIESGSKAIVAGGRVPLSLNPGDAAGRTRTGFLKFPSALADPGARITLPRSSGPFDVDAALGAVIGKRAERVSAADAFSCVCGYTLLADVTDREVFREEIRTNNNLRAKNYPDLSPLGPCIWIPADGGLDPQTEVRLKVNGELRQQFLLEDLAYGIEEMVSAWSRLILEPGDVLGLGAAISLPQAGRKLETPVPIRPGDVLEVESSPIGVLRAEVVGPEP